MQIIVNPASRKGHAKKIAGKIAKALDKMGIEYTLNYTMQYGDAAYFAKLAAYDGDELILCIGGDGTVSEAVSGLVYSDTALGIIPCGTGNDFARYLNIPKDPLKALDIALNGAKIKTDACAANDKIFINAAGSGFDVAALEQTLRFKKSFHGLPAYIFGVLSAAVKFSSMAVRITCDDEVLFKKCMLLSVTNGRYMGGGMCISPHATAFDGMFDVMYVDPVAPYKIPFLLAAFIKGKHKKWDFVHMFRASQLKVVTSSGMLQLDGEIYREHTVNYEILSGAVTVMAPKAMEVSRPEHAEAAAV